MKQKISWKDEADMSLETLLREYGIEGIYQEAVDIFYGEYVIMKLKWGIEFCLVTFLFIFSGLYLWKVWAPVSFELNTALKIALELGLLITYRYILHASFDKHATEVARRFVALANRRPEYFVKNLEEETTDGNEGNADKIE